MQTGYLLEYGGYKAAMGNYKGASVNEKQFPFGYGE